MIELQVHQFCHNCPEFEAKVTRLNTLTHITTVISCERHESCRAIKSHIEKCIKEEVEHEKLLELW